LYNFPLDKLLAVWYNGNSGVHNQERRAQRIKIEKAILADGFRFWGLLPPLPL
jgi:hypothetical protein